MIVAEVGDYTLHSQNAHAAQRYIEWLTRPSGITPARFPDRVGAGRFGGPSPVRSVVQSVPKSTNPPSGERMFDPDALPSEVVEAITRAISEHRENDPTISSNAYLNIIEIEIERLQLMVDSQSDKEQEIIELKRIILEKIMNHLRSKSNESGPK